MRRIVYLLMAAAIPLLAGCGGGGATSETHNTTVSKGQALIDLKKAYDSGAMSQADYQKQRKIILDSP